MVQDSTGKGLIKQSKLKLQDVWTIEPHVWTIEKLKKEDLQTELLTPDLFRYQLKK